MWIYLLGFFIILICYKINKTYNYWKERGVKNLKPTFFFGNTLRSSLKKVSLYFDMKELYVAFPNERYIGIYMLTKPVLIIRDPDLIKAIYIKDFDYFTDHRRFVPDGVDPIWTRNLFLLKGSEWKNMRSVLNPAFTSSKMRMMFSLIQETVSHHINYLKKNNKTRIQIKNTCSRYTNDVTASVAFGINIDSVNNRDNDFYLNAQKFAQIGFRELIIISCCMLFPSFCRLTDLTFSRKSVRKFFHNIVMEIIKIREMHGISRSDMISLLMEEKKARKEIGDILTNEEIVAQATVFLFAGFDTTSNGLTFLLYELSRNPEIQRKLQSEIDKTLKENNDSITYESLIQMKYLDKVVSETLRLWSPALGGDRMCTKPYVIEPKTPEEKRLELKPGDLVWVVASGLQRDPKYFENPDVFDPERFNDSNKDKINSCIYQPFGVGPRICIGMRLAIMEMKTFIFYLLKTYTLIPTNFKPPTFSTKTLHLQFSEEVDLQLKLRTEFSS